MSIELSVELFHETISESRGKKMPMRIKADSLAQIFSEPEEDHRWIVDGLLISGGCSLLGSKPKTGKTTLTRDLALSVATGKEFLGFETVQGPVLILSFEEKRHEIRRHFINMGCSGTEPIFLVTTPMGRNSNEIIEKLVQEIKPCLVIVDTLVHVLGRTSDLNDYLDVTRGIEPLLRLARENDLHLMLVHHLGKQERTGGDGILGSTAIFGMMDTVFLIDRNNGHRTIRSIARYGNDLPLSVIQMDSETKKLALAGSVEEVREIDVAYEYQKVLRTSKEALTETQLDSLVCGRTAVKRKALRLAVEKEIITRMGTGSKSSPYLYSCAHIK